MKQPTPLRNSSILNPKKDGKKWKKRPTRPIPNSSFQKHFRKDRKDASQAGHGGPLRDLLTSSLPDPVQLDAVQTCLEHVQILARQLLGDTSAVVVQGSYAQGLALRGSDLDIAVILAENGLQNGKKTATKAGKGSSRSKRRGEIGEDVVNRRQALHCLQRLAEALSDAKLDEIRIALRIFSAKVPVLRLHCGAKGERNVVVDVSVGGSLLRGACDRAVYSVLQEDQSSGTAAALCRLVKLWAKRRKLTNTLKGGLSSFALVLLTIFFLQQRSGKQCSLPSQLSVTGPRAKPANPENCCPQPLGLEVVASEKELVHLFAEFFEWATEELPKLQNCAISVGSATAQQRTGRFHPLVVEVPFSPQENAARCLRIDVWEGAICQELSRANRMVKQLGLKSGRARASLVRTLFSASASSADPESTDVFQAPESDVPVPYVPDPGSIPSAEEETKSARRSAKRRRKLERSKLRGSKASKESNIMPETVAPVDRWLGLRSLLDPR